MPADRNKETHAIAAAMNEARARGLPEGWSVKFDARRRRKWVSPGPTTRTFDSLPKALAYVSRLAEGDGGDGGKKRPASAVSHALAGPPSKKLAANAAIATGGGATGETHKARYPEDDAFGDDDDDYDDDKEPEPESDAETALDAPSGPEGEDSAGDHGGGGVACGKNGRSRATTVHWDPYSPEGKKVGFRIRIFDDVKEEWRPGRVVRYEPNSNRHKVRYDNGAGGEVRWMRLQNEIVQCGSRLVWALVKGFAWWPAQVLECDPPTPATNKDGYVYVEFFGADQVATIKDTPEFIRPFNNGVVDDVIRKNKKKRNQKAIDLARKEQAETQKVRNEAAKFYAERAFAFANRKASGFLGRRVQFFRSEINYPEGATVKGIVRQHSASSKKWLVSYDFHTKLGVKLDPSWVNIMAKDCSHIFLDKEKNTSIPSEEDLAPFLFGFSEVVSDGASSALSVSTSCSGCMESFPDDPDVADVVNLICGTCCMAFHPGCLDPPMTPRAAERIMDDGDCWLCPKCRTCRGCRRLDVAFGTRAVQTRPPTLFLPQGEALELCSACAPLYDQDRYCPDCGHTWDDAKYQRTQRLLRWENKTKAKNGGRPKKQKKDEVVRSVAKLKSRPGANDALQGSSDGEQFAEFTPDTAWFYPESTMYGFNEGAMLICDSCNLWVHAGCAGLSRQEYEDTNRGVHPVYSKEFLCRTCCVSRCKFLVEALQKEDSMLLFATPVTEQMAPNYKDVIKLPMDLQTMMERAQAGRYHNYAWIRTNFELMVSNALTFNAHGSKLWDEAKRYYELCMHKVFVKYGKAAPPGQYHAAVHKAFADAKRAKEMEAERVQLDETTEKKDLVAGAHVRAVELSPLSSPSDPESCLQISEVWMSPVDAFYCAWMECCFGCGSSGASDAMLFCVDCGESYHSFCADAPILSMTDWAVSGWRCPNCKICEIAGDVPDDESKMIFCEMCDRAFTISELSPPLKSVPTGLFICGQCVDCKSCKNRSEKGKISLRYWSRDPNKCFRCGGCKGLVERQTKGMKCAVCSCLWRSGDTDLVPCVKCKRNIHAHCYDGIMRGQAKDSYECPICRKKDDEKRLAKQLQKHLYEQSRQVLMTCHKIRGSSLDECHSKLFDEIEWQMRSAWIGEYRNIVADGERLLETAKKKYGRKLHDLFVFDEKGPQAPVWMVRRASRWIRYKEKRNSLVETEEKQGTRAVVLRAKMAAAFIQLACWSEGISLRKAVRSTDRLKSLLVSPSEDTVITLLPAEKIKLAGSHIIQENEWATKYFDKDTFDSLLAKESKAKQSSVAASTNGTAGDSAGPSQHGTYEALTHSPIIASPLLGWGKIDKTIQETHPWKDPRSCTLCGGCGDDDAGVISGKSSDAESNDSGVQLAHAGRLLPMHQGLWCHAACALWSSEVWENPEDALIYALEKARYRGSKLKCFGCGRPGATIGCQKQNCSFNYHFPCAKACGAVFTKHQQMFCKNHKSSAEDMMEIENYEVMKPLKAASEQESEDTESTFCYRAGSLVVHSFGRVDQDSDDFHSQQHITPVGYIATRIFWSFSHPRTRTLYFLKVECCGNDKQKSVFTITAADAPSTPIEGHTITETYNLLIRRVEQANVAMFSEGDFFSTKPRTRVRRKNVFGLNGPQFFGFGLTQVRKMLETLPGIAAVAVPLSPSTQPYLFCFKHPSEEEIKDLQRKRAVKVAEKALENVSGCARTEGMCAVARSGGSGRITRALVKRAEEDKSSNVGGSAGKGRNNISDSRNDVDSNIQEKYREMKSVPMKDRLEAKRSHIHGWGLFTKNNLPKHAMIVEYMGETIRQRVADKRERAYETSGVGSCYMFRLDQTRIVDATMIGCMARFMNHCCQPNAYAKVISVNTDLGIEKKIVVFANRKISAGEEITYDYKFPVEDGSLRCTCGAPNCIGRMN